MIKIFITYLLQKLTPRGEPHFQALFISRSRKKIKFLQPKLGRLTVIKQATPVRAYHMTNEYRHTNKHK